MRVRWEHRWDGLALAVLKRALAEIGVYRSVQNCSLIMEVVLWCAYAASCVSFESDGELNPCDSGVGCGNSGEKRRLSGPIVICLASCGEVPNVGKGWGT